MFEKSNKIVAFNESLEVENSKNTSTNERVSIFQSFVKRENYTLLNNCNFDQVKNIIFIRPKIMRLSEARNQFLFPNLFNSEHVSSNDSSR